MLETALVVVLRASLGLTLLAACVGCSDPEERLLTVQVVSGALPSRLDPYQDTRVGALNVFGNVFEPLVQLGPDGKVTPALAVSWENPEPHVCQFRLRPDVRFHDGKPFSASDVVASMEAARSSLLAGQISEVVAVEALDDHTVRFRTAVALDAFVYHLTAVPISRRGPSGEFVGTGPFRLLEFQAGARVRLQRFPGWYGQRPIIDDVTFRVFADAQDALRLIAEQPRSIVISPPREVLDRIRTDERFHLVRRPGRSVYYLAFGLAKAQSDARTRPSPFLDVRVRRAVRAALDLEQLVAVATPAGGLPATQFVTSGGFGFDPSLRAPVQDQAEGQRLLAEAGYPSGFEAVFDVGTSDRLLGEEIARQLLAVGIRLQVNVLPGEAFLAKIDAGHSALYAYSWLLGRGSGTGFMNFFHSRDPERRRGLRNRTGYYNPKLDAALEAVVQEPAGPGRARMQRGIMRILMEDLPWVPLFSDHTARVHPRELNIPWRDDGLLRLWEASPAEDRR